MSPAICPVCGMPVEETSPWKSTYEGKTYYFHEKAEKDAFDANPQAYTRQAM